MAALDLETILALSGDMTQQNASISPEVAFILSRLDGKTDLGTVSFMAGIDSEKIITLLAPLLQQGLIKIVGQPTKKEAGKKIGSMLDLLEHEENEAKYAKIPREFRREVLLLMSRLGEISHYELLQVERSATAEKIKTSYFRLSKQYHPDRFFSNDIGHYRKKITKVFEAVNKAFEVLSDEKLRKQYNRSLDEAAGKVVAGQEPENPMVANLNRARRYYQWGEEDYQRGNYISAASNFLLACNFDPENDEFKRAYERVKPTVQRKRLKELQAKVDEKIDEQEYGQAYALLQQWWQSNSASPDAEMCLKLARVALQADVDLKEVTAYNQQAIASMGETAYSMVTNAMICEKKKNVREALAYYERAKMLEPENLQIQRGIERIMSAARKKR